MPSCRLLPHGTYTLFPAVLSTLAWLASLSQDGCDYAHLTGPIVEEATNSNAIPYLVVGFTAYREPTYNNGSWNVQFTGPCFAYDQDVMGADGKWKAAKGFAFLALVLGGGGALFLWFSSCFVFSRGTWRWAGYEVLLAFVFQTMAFLWFGTGICQDPNNCTLSYGSRADIAAAVFWLVAAISILLRYPKPVPIDDDDDNEQPRPIQGGSHDGDSTTAPPTTLFPVSEMTDVALDLPLEGDSLATLAPTSKGSVVHTKVADGDII